MTEEKDNENVILLKDHLFIHQLDINIYNADDYYNNIIKRLEKILGQRNRRGIKK